MTTRRREEATVVFTRVWGEAAVSNDKSREHNREPGCRTEAFFHIPDREVLEIALLAQNGVDVKRACAAIAPCRGKRRTGEASRRVTTLTRRWLLPFLLSAQPTPSLRHSLPNLNALMTCARPVPPPDHAH
jgi:hypothetical protein